MAVSIGNFFASFDTEAVVQQLIQARSTVLNKLDLQSSTATAKRSALAGIQSKLSSLLAAANTFSGANSVTGKNAYTSAAAVSALATASAPVGSFTVDVVGLATGTSLSSSATISAPIDASSPLGSSDFAVTPTNGTFSIGTATGGSATIKIGPEAALPGILLNASNFTTAPTTGSFTIVTATGGSAVINVDTATQTLQDVVDAINASPVGITAGITNDANGRANRLTLVSTQGTISLGAGGDTSNFLTAAGLTTGIALGTTVGGATSFTKQMSLNDVIADINASGVGITASITNDANAKANIVTLTSTQGNIALGNASDSSNFLSATNLLASAAGTTRASTASMARISLTTKMATASWNGGPPTAGTHSITINGATINYDTSVDSLSDILDRISSSAAGVTAHYDATSDTVRLQQVKTGSMAVTLADDGSGGNLLSKLGLLAATQTLGQNAQYKIDGGATQSAASNTVDLGNGITLNLTATTTVGSPVTVNIAQDTNTALSSARSLVSAFNAALSSIDSATKADGSKTNNRSGVLSGDASLRSLKDGLRGLMSNTALSPGGNFKTLSQVGFSFGVVGSKPGSTNTLQLDEAKFTDALKNDPASVQAVLSAFSLNATLTPGGTGSISGISGTYTGTDAGTYGIKDDGAGTLTAMFHPSNGGPPTTQSATVTAGGTNNSLIPGMTLTIGGTLQQGSNSVSVSATKRGIMRMVKDYVDVQAGAGGVMQSRQDTYSAAAKDIEAQKVRMQASIDAEAAVWRKKFTAMEDAQRKYQAISNSLTQMTAQWSANAKG
jgi:flagellar hook-associated protein 2